MTKKKGKKDIKSLGNIASTAMKKQSKSIGKKLKDIDYVDKVVTALFVKIADKIEDGIDLAFDKWFGKTKN